MDIEHHRAKAEIALALDQAARREADHPATSRQVDYIAILHLATSTTPDAFGYGADGLSLSKSRASQLIETLKEARDKAQADLFATKADAPAAPAPKAKSKSKRRPAGKSGS